METFADYSLLIRMIVFLLLSLGARRLDGANLGGCIEINTNLTLDGSPFVVTQDVVVANNATLTIQPGVELQFQSGVAFQVNGSLQAKGTSDEKIVFRKIPTNNTVVNVTSPYNDGIRLRDGSNYRVGRLEIFLRGSWGTVCDDSFDMNDAQVACRQLGFLGAKRYYTHGGGNGSIWLDDLRCRGTENTLLECSHRGVGSHNCRHYEDIAVECDVSLKVASKVYWKGVKFSTSSKPAALQYVEISEAYEALKGAEYLPNLHHVTVKNSVYAVRSHNMNSPLIISDCRLTGNMLVGIEIKSRHVETTILNTIVENTTNGEGLNYTGLLPNSKDFCATNVSNISFPISLEAEGKLGTIMDCFKIIRTRPGRKITMHYQSVTGQRFELDVHDGDTINATVLTTINQWAGVNQAVTPVTSSGHAIYIRFRYRGWYGASVRFMLMEDNDLSSLVISNCSFNDNREKGMELKNVTAKVSISTTAVFRNKAGGLLAERILGTISTSNTYFVNNSAHGFEILDSSFVSCNLHQVSTIGNSQNGLYFQRVALKSNVSDSMFDGNAQHGFALNTGAGEIEFRNITAVLNGQSGVRFYDGKTSSKLFFSDLTSNGQDGWYMTNEGGPHHLFNCTVNNNARNGITLFDVRRLYWSVLPQNQFVNFILEASVVKGNAQYGLELRPESQYRGESTANVTMTINNNHICRNNRGGILLEPEHYSAYWHGPRHIEAAVRENHFEENKMNAFYVHSRSFLGLKAVIGSNKFINNTDKVITLFNSYTSANTAIQFDVRRNIFSKNQVENVLFIDYSSFSEKRSATITNNSFDYNEAVERDWFPNFFHRTTTHAIIVVKEGKFTLQENTFNNPNFDLQLSTLCHDHRRVIDARFNWWGTEYECEIVEKIFDFRHRVQLSLVEFFPYLLSSNKSSAVNSEILRPSCFIRKASIGGIVDRPLDLPSSGSPYEVRDDVIILTNGSLTIPKNVTLLFPPRSVMFVQGTLLVDGGESEKVQFKGHQDYSGDFRLFGGSGPWEGRLEFWVNETWMPMCLPYYRSFSVEGKVICQRLNLYYKWYHRHSPYGQVNAFVHNVVCDKNADAGIMDCRADTWSHSCPGYVVHIYCQEGNWAGLHLAMSDHQSLLRHLDITDAGFAYRSDIGILGAALRIDFNHHNISNIYINNSAGMGVQVVHQSLLYHSLILNSTISTTESDGVHYRSPSLTLMNANIIENKGNGFVCTSTWDQTNTFAMNMASSDVYKTFHPCSKNLTFLPANRVYYFVLEKLDPTLRQTCQHVMETKPGYKLVIQELYYYNSLSYHSNFIDIYDGVNMSTGSSWKMKRSAWEYPPVFNSTGPSVLFNFKNDYPWWSWSIKFLVYTVEEGRHVENSGGEIVITGSKINRNGYRGVFISGSWLQSVKIANTEVLQNERGIVLGSHVGGGEISITRSKINKNSYYGIYMYGGRYESLLVGGADISYSRGDGIHIQSSEIGSVKISSTNFQQNGRGIAAYSTLLSEFIIENCAINGSLRQGIYIYWHMNNIIRILNSSVTFSGDRGLTISNHYWYHWYNLYMGNELFVSGTTFAWNRQGAVSSHSINMHCESSNFFRNYGPTIEIFDPTSYGAKWTFLNNSFDENYGFAVITITANAKPAVIVRGNRFSSNQCPGKAVIHIPTDASKFVIRENVFESNLGICVLLEGTAAYVPLNVTNNVFKENECPQRSVIEALRLDENARFSDNNFTLNRAQSVVLIQMVHNIYLTSHRKEIAFTNNTLSQNAPYSSTHFSGNNNKSKGESCAVVLAGIQYYKYTDFHLNKFNNSNFATELCVRVPAISQSDIVNVTHNWWGTAKTDEVCDRIWDFDDNYDFAIADSWPFLLRDDDSELTSYEQHDFKQHGDVLSGRLFKSLTLRASQSPYSVISDFTVLENVTLSIEAGVTIRVSPGVGILVAGELQARGTSDKPIIFTVKEPGGIEAAPYPEIRLVDGNFPWEGRAEVFHGNSWKPISASDYTSLRNVTDVICRQLGYGLPVEAINSKNMLGRNSSGSLFLEVRCHGNETSLQQCSFTEYALNYSENLAVVKCQMAAWGNLRFISTKYLNNTQVQSALVHVEVFYCGNRHGNRVPAIEAEANVPNLRFVTVRNCTSGGIRIHTPEIDVKVQNSAFLNAGKIGVNVLQTERNIIVENSESSTNERGIYFDETRANIIPQVHYGRVFLCSEDQTLLFHSQTLLYFKIPGLKNTRALESCQKVLTVSKGHGIKITLLYFHGTQQFQVYDSASARNIIVDKSAPYQLTTLVHKHLFIPHDAVLVRWTGDVTSEVLIQVQDFKIEDAPCTYEIGFCGWQTFSNMSISGHNATETWRITSQSGTYYHNIGADYTYFHRNGKFLFIGGNLHWSRSDGHAGLVSSVIGKHSQFCSLAFFYRLGIQGRAGLSLYRQTGTYPNIRMTLIWSANNVHVMNVMSWKKVIVDLPTDVEEYRLLLEGKYNGSYWWWRNYVIIDNLELRSCSVKEHRISNSIFRGNSHQAINYTSVATGSDARPRLVIERCKITDTAVLPDSSSGKGAISLEIQDNSFTLSNSFITGSRLGAVQAHLGRSDGTKVPKIFIYGNTFDSNTNGTIVVEPRRGIKAGYSVVYIVENTFESNSGLYSTVKISEMQSEIVKNFFHNNSGLHCIQYNFSTPWPKEQKCEFNTFFMNTGTGHHHGVTVLSNGPMQYRRNNFKNPSNLYEFSSTREPAFDVINAVENWWGFATESAVGLRLYEKEDDHKLARVEYKPFLKLPPRTILSIGCPADWLKLGSTCYVFKRGSRTFNKAQEYCEYYGGHVASTDIPGDNESINLEMQAKRPDGKLLVPVWVTPAENMDEENERGRNSHQNCTVMTQNRIKKIVPCNSLYPFICTNHAVIRCPNGCFRNGDCVGATCFCYPGWTGSDCSQFDCNDVHSCSGNGQCVGPNLCKCRPGFLGRGCTYSYCTKFRRCSTCTPDSACGWCDSLQQCMPGTSSGPYEDKCLDWFYYACYTVGSHCSKKIQRVDCKTRQCNMTQEESNSESCQKCKDLEKCYNQVEEGKCRAWNDTQCPNGLVKVDYTDPKRIESTLLRKNVKVIDPNTTTIYSCPVMLPGRDDTTSVFVVPKDLEINVGDVLSSAQAGGLMHKVNFTTDTGPYTLIIGNPARIEDVIQYADFTQRVLPVQLADKSTVDEDVDEEELSGLINGSIKLNETDLHVLPANASVFKCVGHIYKIGDELVSTQFLVLNKSQNISVAPGDVIVSAQSHGFFEKVTRVSHASDVMFVETELERCTENSTWTHRFNPRITDSPPDNDVVCTGGDNSYGLIITEPGQQNQVSVNDSIIGRSSGPFIAKVVESHVSGDFVLVEVLHVEAIINGSAVSAARLDELKKKHRRHKRDVKRKTLSLEKTFKKENKLSLLKDVFISVKQTYKMYMDLTVTVGVYTGRDPDGRFTTTDVMIGAEMTGKKIYNVEVQIGMEHSVEFKKGPYVVVKPVQLLSFCIPIALVCIPSALFFEVSLTASVKATDKVYVPIDFTSSVQLTMGGFCTLTGGCKKINPHYDVSRNLNKGRPTAEVEFGAEVSLVPKVTLRVPYLPRWLRKMVKLFNKVWKKLIKKYVGYSPGDIFSPGDYSIVRLSLEAPFALKAAIKPCNVGCIKKSRGQPNEFTISFGFSEVVGRLAIGFGDKNFELAALSRKLYSGGLKESFCFSIGSNKGNCAFPTTNPYTGSTTSYTGTTSLLTTPAPTTTPPCECGAGKEVIVGPDGNCNCPPECKEGKKAVFVNNRYRCPEHPPCGEHPNCVVGRKGPGCSQPDVQPCSPDCSGNGAAVALPDCGSSCECSVRWTGTCCETRRPLRNWGDPHLETLDGIEFDYFGIGEFWGCKSIFNDFGMQFRFFAYQRASLTGGLALKAGQSVITIMTVHTSDPRELPRLRNNGILVNITAHIGKKMKLDNGTVDMDIAKIFSSKLDDAGVVLISLQFDSGLTVTADVRHSHVMGRQYLNVLFTPTVAFKGHTEGLCGVMDNDPSNDLRGSDGQQYNDPIQFAESWRLTTSRNNSGLEGSWSWNSSNFHSDDEMDFSYTNPHFVPMYSMDGIDDAIIAKANELCSPLGLSKTMLQSCVYDVAVTNDTSLSTQETLQQDCPDQCSGKGRCVNSTCQCMIGWSGDSCQQGDCTNCSSNHGKCVKGFCECEDGWQGVTCEEQATCINVNNCTSPNNGICRRTDECRCRDGYIGNDCGIVPTCANVSHCSGRGICIDYDVCKCQKDWTGKNCTQYSCGSLDHCSGHGNCVALYKCDCDPGWTGVSCAVPDCAGTNHCSGQGECMSRDTCRCYPGFQGENCSVVADCEYLGNCSGHGSCVQENPGGNLTCRCYVGFNGANCSMASCLSVNNCSGHGICVEANLCKCDAGYTGDDCTKPSCEGVNYCSGHGVCIGHDICACDPLWHGPACSLANCSNLDDCSNKGDCILPNVCECYQEYDGAACNTTAKPNLHAPVFTTSVYNVSVPENVMLGAKILRVLASDADSGRNAQLFFSLDDANDAGSMFVVNSISGEIFTSSSFDYESSSPHFYKLTVVASDNGLPRKSSRAFAYITIVDQNDNCPVFNSSQAIFFNISRTTNPGTLLTVISAVDKDSGLNGEVRYSILSASNHDGAFELKEENGKVLVAKELKEKEYRLLLVARDLGIPSCSRQIELTVNVFNETTMTTEAPSKQPTATSAEAKNSTTAKKLTTEKPTAATFEAKNSTTAKKLTTEKPTAATFEVAATKSSTDKKPTEISTTQPNLSWYKKPYIILGLSVGGFAVFVLLALAIFLVFHKRKPTVKAVPEPQNFPLGSVAGSDNFGQSTSNLEQYKISAIPRVDTQC